MADRKAQRLVRPPSLAGMAPPVGCRMYMKKAESVGGSIKPYNATDANHARQPRNAPREGPPV